MTTLKQLRVVIASPSDVKKEREALDKVIEEVNDITAEGLGLTLKTVRWETIPILVFMLMGSKKV